MQIIYQNYLKAQIDVYKHNAIYYGCNNKGYFNPAMPILKLQYVNIFTGKQKQTYNTILEPMHHCYLKWIPSAITTPTTVLNFLVAEKIVVLLHLAMHEHRKHKA